MTQDKWLAERLAYLRGLKAPSDQQRLLLMLADKPDRTANDGRKLAALVRAEKAAERARKVRSIALSYCPCLLRCAHGNSARIISATER